MPPSRPIELVMPLLAKDTVCLDLGCGRGRDSIALAEHGFTVTAVDYNSAALKELPLAISAEARERIETVLADITRYPIPDHRFGLISCQNALQFQSPEESHKLIDKMKERLLQKGWIALASFTTHDPSSTSPHPLATYFTEQEMLHLFAGWKILLYEEATITDKPHPGAPKTHQHRIVRIVAQKPPR